MAALSSIIDDLTDIARDLGALGDERTRDLTATHDPETTTAFAVESRNGTIEVHPTDGDAVVVDAVARSRHEDDDLDAVTLDFETTDDTLVLSVAVPDGNRATSVDLDVGVPDALAVTHVVSKNAEVDVRDVHGDTHVETTNGKIRVTDVDGSVTVHARNGAIAVRDTPVRDVASKNGKIDLALPGIDADTTVEAKNGKLTIAVPADADADFDLSATHGTVSVEGLSCLVESESRHHVTGELGAGGPRLDAHTKNGTVTLRAR